MVHLYKSSDKVIRVFAHLAYRIQWGVRRRPDQFLRKSSADTVNPARRSLLTMTAAATALVVVPRIAPLADAAAKPGRYKFATINDATNHLKRAFEAHPPPHSGDYGDGFTDATKPVQAVLDNVAAAGGGDIYVPRGDYPLNIKIAGSNIRMICEEGTIFRAANPHSVVNIVDGADHIEITGPSITGQTTAQERGNSSPNVTALHCISIAGANVTIRQFSTKAARQDGLYIKHVADMQPTNLTLEDFDIGSTSRNPVTVIAARNTTFRRGRIRLDNSYAGHSGVKRGYVLFDLEPNNVHEKTRGIKFDNIDFVNASAKSSSKAIVLGKTHNGTDIYDVHFNDCRFKAENDKKAPAIRLRPEGKHVENLYIRNLKADGRVFINSAADGIVTIENSRFEHITLGSRYFSYHVEIGSGCFLEYIKSTAGKLTVSGASRAARILHVAGLRNR